MVEGDNWMITQQVAAYMIKKMTVMAESPNTAAADETDALFKEFVRARSSANPLPAQYNVLENDQDIVKSFDNRATTLVCLQWFKSRMRNPCQRDTGI